MWKVVRPVWCCALVSLISMAPGYRLEGSETASDMPPSVQDLAAKVKPSVVTITFDGREGTRQGLGTGFIVAADGLIATNLHVIGEARPIQVQLHDGRKFPVVSIEATEKHHDLALLKIAATELPTLPLGDSDSLREGESLVAIGNPLGLEWSVVTGVLSGRRDVDERDMLQIAMPIERGNSGGPLLDREGRVQGIITLKSLKTDNLGFAAPVNQLKPLLTRPNPIPISQWLTIGVLPADDWQALPGGRWTQRAGRILVEGAGTGIGSRAVCLSTRVTPEVPFEVGVSVRMEPVDGAAGLAFHADGGDRHYGFYSSNEALRLSRFDGPDVYAWTVMEQVQSPKFRPEGWNHFKVRVEANRILCYLNDELVIESTDATYKQGRVGLCKFRDTRAEFRDFQLGTTIPSREPSADLVNRVAATAIELSPNRHPADETIEAYRHDGEIVLDAFERAARDLEARARRVRELATAVHEARVVDEFQQLVDQPEGELDLLHASLLIAKIDNPELDPAGYLLEVDRMADRIQKQFQQDTPLPNRLAALRKDLFEEQGYHGSRHDYEHRSNSYLNEVIDDREGLPITLSVLFMEIGRRLEIPIVGVGLPGHFIVRYQPPDGPGELIDVFDRGTTMTLEQARERAIVATGVWDEEFLQAASSSSILERMLRNLFAEARRAEDSARMLRYTNLILVLKPESTTDRFYRAVLSLQLQRLTLARTDTDWLLAHDLEGISRRAVEDLSLAIDREIANATPQPGSN